ncbi:MAG TPA: hypothetical protein VFC63_18795 [Blastocatellia bacterium]|nr:hypothetical protein [Blastocatellia bacterium]
MSEDKTLDLFLNRAVERKRLNRLLTSFGNIITLLALLGVTLLVVNLLLWLVTPLVPKLSEYALFNILPFRWIVSLLAYGVKTISSALAFSGRTVAILFGVGLASGVFLLLRSWFSPISLLAMAQEIDIRFGLHDRLSSAVEFRNKKSKSDFVRAATADAAAQIAKIDPEAAVPVRIPRSIQLTSTLAAYAATMAVTVIIGLVLALTLSTSVTEAKAKIKVDTGNLRADIEELKKEAALNGDRVSENINKKIEDILNKLEKGELSKEEALKELSDLQREIQQDQQGEEDLDKTMQQMANDFARSQMSSDVADQLQQKNSDAASEKMEELSKQVGNGDMTKQQSDSLRDALNAAAKSAGNSQDSDMKQMSNDLKQSAEQMNQGDNKGASQQLQKAADDLKKLGQKDSNNQRLDEAKRQLDNIRDSIQSASEQKNNDGQQQSGNQQSGQQKSDKSQSGSNQQGGSQKGQPGDSKDQNNSSMQNGQQPDQNSNDAQGKGLNAGAQPGDKKLEDPSQRSDAKQKEEIEGQAGDQKPPESTDKKSDLNATTNYKNTVTAAERAAQDVINHDDVPPSYRRVVKKYFNSIKPKK